MRLQTKALYNLVRFTSYHNHSIKTKKWQIEDLSKSSDDDLFKKLKRLNLNLDKKVFLEYAKALESPEELSEILTLENDYEIQDQIYLVIFELFKRFFPQKKCLSIFCDELDYQIFLYDTNKLKNDEHLQDALAHLKVILESNADIGISKKEAFQNLMQYFAHDLENFLFDYISDQIEANNDTYSYELIDGFYPYISKKLWFDFLKAKLKSKNDIALSNEIIENIFDELKNRPNLELQIKILNFMVETGDRDLFIKMVKETISHLKKEKEFKNILEIVADFFNRLDKEDMENKISNLISKRSKINSESFLKKQD